MWRMRVFLLVSAVIISGKLPRSQSQIWETSKIDLERDSEVSNGGGRCQPGVRVGKSGSVGNHGGPRIHLANARKIELHQWKSGCNTNWYYQMRLVTKLHDFLKKTILIWRKRGPRTPPGAPRTRPGRPEEGSRVPRTAPDFENR